MGVFWSFFMDFFLFFPLFSPLQKVRRWFYSGVPTQDY